MSRSKKKKSINKIKIRNLIIACIIAIFLFSIYKFNFLTKSEVTPTTAVKFVELGTGNAVDIDVELFKDENEKYYIVLPEKVNGFFARKYFINEKEVAFTGKTENENTIKENSNIDIQFETQNNNNPNNEPVNNVVTNVENNIINNKNTINSDTTQNTNTKKENNQVENNKINTDNIDQTNTKTDLPVSAMSDSLFDLATAINNGENILEKDEAIELPEENKSEENSESNSKENPKDNQDLSNTTNNIINNNTIDNNIVNNNQVEENKQDVTEKKDEANQKPQMPNIENDSNSNIVKEENLNIYSAGERIYLTKEEAENGTYSIEVEYETLDINNLKLYKQELKSNLGDSGIKLTGFIPAGYYLKVTLEDVNMITELKADTEELKDSEVLLAYDIKILNENTEYQPKDYYQAVNVEITSGVRFAGKIDNKPVEVIHIAEDEQKNEIRFEKISLVEKESDKIEFITNEFSTYAVLAYASIQNEYVNVYDYDSDYNYYTGKNYTDNNKGINQNLYTNDNLAKVTINYYGYDYDKDLNTIRNFNIVPNWRVDSDESAGGQNRRYVIGLTANTSKTQLVDEKNAWQLSFELPQNIASSFLITETQRNNNAININYDANTRIVTVQGNDWSVWEKNSSTSYFGNLALYFSARVDVNRVNNLKLTAVEKNIVGYVSADSNERQNLFTYVKCIPIINGNISFELIDNPYMDRPAGFGFDGWTTHENGYNFAINNENKVQTLTINTNGNKELTVNLYANWQEAKVVFIDANARNDGDGLTPQTPVNNWDSANSALGTAKQAQNASSRELNIIVLINGVLRNLSTLGNKAYTLTSLYDGIDYRNNASLNLESNFTLSNDLQLDYLNITGSNNYTSTTTTGTINRYINGSARNLRIGRGMMPFDSAGSRTTFAQVLGGGNADRAYRLVIESGKYANIQTASTNSTSQTLFANMTLGCDYDRVTDTNTNLYVYNRIATRAGSGTLNPRVSGKPLFEIIVKSGTLGIDYFNSRNSDYAFSGIYLGGHSSGTDNGDRVMIVEGGNIANILGGLAIQSNNSTVKTCIYVKGGNVQNIVGGAGVSTTRGDRTIQVTDGNVAYSVSGGSNGYTAGESSSANPTGQLVGDTLIYVGGNAVIGTEDITSSLYNVNAGCVLGAGDGNNILPETAGKVDSTHVIVDGNAYIANSVYGGGNYGVVGEDENSGGSGGTPLIELSNKSNNIVSGEKYLITNGTRVSNSRELIANGNNIDDTILRDTVIPSSNEEWIVTRSGNGYTIQNASTGRYLALESAGWFNARLITGTNPMVFTYSNDRLSASYNGRTYYLRYSNGWTTTTSTWNASNIYFLQYIKLDIQEPEDPEALPTKVKIDIYGGKIGQNVYGGANRNNIYGSVDINIYNGDINGTVYGGSNTEGTIFGAPDIDIEGGTFGLQNNLKDIIFAGGKGENTVINQKANIDILDKSNNVFLYGNIYGGSELGQVKGNSYINIQDIYVDTNSILMNGNIYGGGKGENRTAAQNNGNVTVTIDGGNYPAGKAFGGCNINGSIAGNVLVNIGKNYSTTLNEVYGGGNQSEITADTNNVYVYLFKNATVENAFNGGNSAGIEGNNTQLPRAIYAKGATVANIYGGSNSSGTLSETFVYCDEGSIIGNVYGGGYGQNTDITGNTNVNITSIDKSTGITHNPLTQITGNVYGGGDNGPVNGYTNVNIISSAINGTVYGGGNNAEVGNDTNVMIDSSNINTVFGGGNLGIIRNNTNINIINTSKIGTLYGGGCSAAVNGYTDVYVEGCEVDNVYGGGQGVAAVVQNYTNIILDPARDTKTVINQNVYGGGDQGKVNGKTLLNLTNAQVKGTVYGGGNRADIGENTSVNIIEKSSVGYVYGGGNEGKVGTTTSISIIDSEILDTVYGGGNKGAVGGNTTVRVDSSNIANSIFGGGNAANVNGTQVTFQAKSQVKNIYGGGNQGEVIETSNIIIDDSNILNNLYAGGNGATAIQIPGTIPGKVGKDTNCIIRNNTQINGSTFGGGQGITAIVNGNTSIDITGSIIEKDMYGGGDNGAVNGNTSLAIDSATIQGNTYAAGNGANATVLGNSAVYTEGNTYIGKSLYGGGNAAETGVHGDTKSLATVDIAGAIIKENIYGGANSSQINGSTIINIGNSAIDEYYGVAKNYKQGKIEISGTVYGGGQSMNPNSDVWDDTAISVTKEIHINVFGDGYDKSENDTLVIGGSIFGSGNASNAAKDGFLTIRNYGTEQNRKKLQSIQRCSISRIDNSVLMIAGVKDSTSQYKETPFTFNKIGELKLQNNSILYLKNGANRVSKFESLNADGTTYANVDIGTDYKVNASSDNRIYMANGTNLNICYGDPQNLEVSPVKGMTFFGMYKSAPTGYNDPDGIYKGIYDQSYVTGNKITDWNSREYLRTYVYGEHTKMPEQDITKDGFYTNFEELDPGFDYGNISIDNYSAKSYTSYIQPTPEGDYSYYYWYAGPDQDTYIYDLELVASKFSTMGTVELPFSDMNFPDATLTMSGIDTSGLEKNVEFVNKNEIPNIDPDTANSKFGLSMKTGNTGWSMAGNTDFYTGGYEGTTKYQFENAQTTPSLSFFLHHANNITEDRDLGRYTITMNLSYWKDSLNKGTALVIINITMFTRVYEGAGYNTAITPGMQYDLFSRTLTNITTKSSFSAYFEMGEVNFFDTIKKTIENTGIPVPNDYYDNSYRLISSGAYVFPENTTITMIDRYDKNNPTYYYYTVSAEDEKNGKKLFKLNEFLVMGSTDEYYDEAKMRDKYYIKDKDYQYENFIFIVNFESADFERFPANAKITPDNTYFEMFLRTDITHNGETTTIDLAKIINDQYQTTGYGIYKTDTTIGIEANLSRKKIYLGTDVKLNVKTTYNASNSTATIFDTRYFDKKLGIKLTFLLKQDNGQYLPIAGGTMLGTEFVLNEKSYYPRVDGTTRIKIAELVSNSSSVLTLSTKNSTLPTGDYRILVESFGSADGIYFGLEASASDTVDMQIVNDIYGLKSTLPEEQVIIDKETGFTLEKDTGYISKGNNNLNINLEYISGLTDPYVSVSLYRRNYDDVYDMSYTKVNLEDYVNEKLELLDSTNLPLEYKILDTKAINGKVTNPDIPVTFNIDYTLKPKLKTGTYKLMFTLYDKNIITKTRPVEDENGNIIQEPYEAIEYENIGETYSYIIIK